MQSMDIVFEVVCLNVHLVTDTQAIQRYYSKDLWDKGLVCNPGKIRWNSDQIQNSENTGGKTPSLSISIPETSILQSILFSDFFENTETVRLNVKKRVIRNGKNSIRFQP